MLKACSGFRGPGFEKCIRVFRNIGVIVLGWRHFSARDIGARRSENLYMVSIAVVWICRTEFKDVVKEMVSSAA